MTPYFRIQLGLVEVRGLDWWKRRIAINPVVTVRECPDHMMWYSKRIGHDFTIERVDRDGLWAREGGQYNAINLIRFEDVRA